MGDLCLSKSARSFTIDGYLLQSAPTYKGSLLLQTQTRGWLSLWGSKGKHSIREQIEPHLSSIYDALKAFSDYNFQQLPIYVTAQQINRYAGLYVILIDIDNALQELK